MSDFLVVRDSQVIHATDSLAAAAAFSGEVYGSTVYEKVVIESGKPYMNRLKRKLAADEAEAEAIRKGGAE